MTGRTQDRNTIPVMAPRDVYLNQPDSREKLEADLDKCIEADDYCRYYSTSGICSKCTRPDNDGGRMHDCCIR